MEPALAIFATLLGHCWQAQVTPTDVDTHCFTDMWNGGHVRDRHTVTHKGKAVYEGETIYSFDGRQIVFTYYNSLGGVGTGTARASGPVITFAGSMQATPKDKPQPMRTEWRLLDEGYDVISGGKKVEFRLAR